MSVRVLVYGESQAYAICRHLTASLEGVGCTKATFRYSDINTQHAEDILLADLEESDALVLQVGLGNSITGRTAVSLMRMLRGKTLFVIPAVVSTAVWPFDGADPKLDAVPGAGIQLRGDSFLRDHLDGGGDPARAADEYLAADIPRMVDLDALLSSEIAGWRELDRLTDVPLADFVEANFRSQRLFLSVFAPTNLVIRQIVDRLIEAFDLGGEIKKASDRIFEIGEIMKPVLPVHPSILAHHKVTWKNSTPGRSGEAELDFLEWARLYASLRANDPPAVPSVQHEKAKGATPEDDAGFLLKMADLKVNPIATPARAFLQACLNNFVYSKAQLFQDVFVLLMLDWRRNGFFVEFGATDGLNISNTYMLEKNYGWSGILAEPFPFWHEQLRQNRTCSIDHRCVWSQTGEHLQFSTSEVFPEYATIASYQGSDMHKDVRERSFTNIEVETVSLNDLLREHGAPKNFDYLSVDTEGSEFAILNALDFNAYCPKIITVEHNYNTMQRDEIRNHLASAGYVRKLEEVSQWDDWYIHEG